jgi:peptidyl-prolyl cis-trans isomerase A (cyclophilin A)
LQALDPCAMFRAMSSWIRVALAAAVVFTAGACEHKKKTESETVADTSKKPTDGKADGSGAGAMTPQTNPNPVGSGAAGSGAAGSGAGSAAPPALPSSSDTVREPVADDLAEYLKNVPGTGDKVLAEIKTSEGTLHCVLFADKATMTVANFVGLATGQKAWKDPNTKDVKKATPYYDGLTFHRVAKGFMIQGGDPLGNGTGGPGYTFAEETYPDLKHEPGTMSMAKTSAPHSTGSQFFVMEAANSALDGGYSVFGKCKEVDIVKKMTALEGVRETPTKKITIEKVTISKGS